MNPQISIIVPVYNVEPYLRKCLDSILVQTFTGWECVLVDDGSTDVSGGICDEYAAKDPRFIVVHKHNEGVSEARITAFEHSKGKLVTFIDADDFVSSEYLEKLSKPILEDDADMVSCSFYDVYGHECNGAPIPFVGQYAKNDLRNFIANHYFYDKETKRAGMPRFLCTKLVKREFVKEALSYGKGLWFGEDQIAVFCILLKINKLHLLGDRLYYYVHYAQQTTKRYNLSLWKSLITMFIKYEELDYSKIAQNGIRIRVWQYVYTTIFMKMAQSVITRNEFCQHLQYVREDVYMNKFFRHTSTGMNLKQDIIYWLLKLKCYTLLYMLIVYIRKNN